MTRGLPRWREMRLSAKGRIRRGELTTKTTLQVSFVWDALRLKVRAVLQLRDRGD
jgi:hypothetical protein